GEKLAEVARELGLPLVSKSGVRADAQDINAEVLSAAYVTEEGETALPVPLADGGATYVQVTKVTPSRVPALAEVKERVVRDWQATQRQLMLQQDAAKVLAAAHGGVTTPMATLAGQSGVPGVQVSQLRVKDL